MDYPFPRRSRQKIICVGFLLTLLIGLLSNMADADEFQFKPFIEIVREGRAKEYYPQYQQEAVRQESAGNIRKAAAYYQILSWLGWTVGDYQKGIDYGKKSIALAEKTGALWVQGWASIGISLSYYQIGDFDNAKIQVDAALSIARQRGFPQMESRAYRSMAKILMKTGEEALALEYHKRSLEFYESLLAAQDATRMSRGGRSGNAERMLKREDIRRFYVANLIAAGHAYERILNHEAAIDHFRKALHHGSDLRDRAMDAYLGLGIVYLNTGDYSRSIEYLAKAVTIADQLDIPFFTTLTHAFLGRAYLTTNDNAKALSHYEKAAAAVEDQRSLLQTGEARSSYFDQMTGVYNGLITTLLHLGKREAAFDYSERARARAFLDVLGNRVDLSHGKASALIDEERELKRKIAEVQALGDESGQDGNRKEMGRLQKEYQAFLAKLRQADQEHASLISVAPLTLKEVRRMLPENTILMQFHVFEHSVFVWVVRSDTVRTMKVPVERRELLEKIRAFRAEITGLAPEAVVKSSARALYAVLFKDLQLAADHRLIVVPHDVLHYLPFQSLITPNGNYLIEEHGISYLSSASLMQFTIEKRKKSADSILAFGNPDLGDPSLNLRYAEREVKEIGRLFPTSAIYVRKEATERRAKEKAADYPLIHFATHGEFNEKDPLASSLKLSPENSSSGDLTTAEIFRLKLNASLVVLSACESALGRISSGDEIVGLTRAFIYAGTPSVVTTLWKVDDKATYLLMQSFYQNLKRMSKGEALRKAQISLMRSLRHPYFWGAFVLTGDAE